MFTRGANNRGCCLKWRIVLIMFIIHIFHSKIKTQKHCSFQYDISADLSVVSCWVFAQSWQQLDDIATITMRGDCHNSSRLSVTGRLHYVVFVFSDCVELAVTFQWFVICFILGPLHFHVCVFRQNGGALGYDSTTNFFSGGPIAPVAPQIPVPLGGD